MSLLRRRPVSLTMRVMLFVGMATSLCLLAVGVVVQSSIERHFAEQDAGELQVVADSVIGILQTELGGNQASSALGPALAQAVSGHHGVYFQVANDKGQIAYASPGADLTAADSRLAPTERVVADSLQTWSQDGKSYRGAVLEFASGPHQFTITTATDMDFHLHFLASFNKALWGIMGCAAALTLLAAWVGVHQGHAPLRKLSGNIRNIQSDHLHVRLDPETAPVELQDLVLSFNQMIGRLEEGFVRLTNFSADIAHELRTPLTNLITQTQVGLSKARDQSEYRELLYSNLEEQERLARMVSDMLWLAQADHGLVKPEFATLDLAVEVQDSIEYLTAWAEESQVRLAVQGEGQLVKGDRAMLRRALLNLLANAISHTPAGGLVTIRLDPPANGLVRLAVENTGETIPAEHLSKIFDRFYRIDPSRQRHKEGVGLGLAIVHSIIAVHGGQVEARSSAGLTIFTLTLPALVAAE